MSDLLTKHCQACEGLTESLNAEQIQNLMPQLQNWRVDDDNTIITKQFKFKDFYETMAFINAFAFMAHKENHHPDINFGYNYCEVNYTTHALNGLSHNDFICAAKVDALLSD
jgi:4a-hydroxytetrahydrobiopterin dehydratase